MLDPMSEPTDSLLRKLGENTNDILKVDRSRRLLTEERAELVDKLRATTPPTPWAQIEDKAGVHRQSLLDAKAKLLKAAS